MKKVFYLHIIYKMANRSDLSGKWPRASQTRSHSMHATKKWSKPNIIRKWVDIDGMKLRIKMTAKEYKKLRKDGAI